MEKVGGKVKLREMRNSLKRRLGKIRRFKIKNWMLIVMLIPLLFVDATMLRLNHIKMTELRDAVMSADAENNDAGREEGLIKLKEVV